MWKVSLVARDLAWRQGRLRPAWFHGKLVSVASISEADRARYHELLDVLRLHVEARASELLAALLLDSEKWSAPPKLAKLRKDRLATVRFLKQLASEPFLRPAERAAASTLVKRLATPTKREELVSSLHAAAGIRENVMAALARLLMPPKSKKKDFWEGLIRALLTLYPNKFWNEPGAARMAAKRGRAFLVKHGAHPAFSAGLARIGKPSWTLGYLPGLSLEQHVARIAWLRDELAR